MTKILHSTSRGQITLPKGWREKFSTNYYVVEMRDEELILKPLSKKQTLQDQVEDSWKEYTTGKVVSGEDLMKKYGL